MKLSSKLLGSGEYVILHVRTHVKALFVNIILGVIICVAAVLAVVYAPASWHPVSTIAIIVIAVILEFAAFFWPWINWLLATYTVTNRRLITRQGVFAKTGHDIPLSRISDVSYEHDLIDRIFGCGTLVLQTSASDPLMLPDIPRVEEVHVKLADLLFEDSAPSDS